VVYPLLDHYHYQLPTN